MADQAGDLLDRDVSIRKQRDETVPQLTRSPLVRIQPAAATTVQVGPSSVKGTPRSFLTASQKGSSGPTLERRSSLPTQRA